MQPSWRALPSSLRFYAYDDPALDHGWLLDCAAQLHVPIGKHPLTERFAELEWRRLLLASKWRTTDPALATFFYVPIFDVLSATLPGPCNGTRHADRMQRAARALARSPHFQESDSHGSVQPPL